MAAISSSNNNNNSGSNIVQQAATNFNPSWMQQTVPSTRSVLPSQNKPVNADEVLFFTLLSNDSFYFLQTCDPIFAKHSYGREDLLAMRGKDGVKPPVGIEKCPFFVESSLTPVVLLPFTEIEMRLQQNVNSSKALSAFNRTQGHSSNEMNSGGEMTVGGGAWTSTGDILGRSGSGSTSFTAPSRKYQNSDTKVPNRWSALNSSNAGGPPPQRQQSWKNATNGSSGGNLAGGFERPGFREKTGSMNQFERLDSIGNKKNQQESTIGQQTGNDKTTSESVSLDEQKDKGIEHFKQSSATSPKNTSPGHFGTDDFTRHPTTAVISKTNPIETACTVVQPVQQPYKWNYLDPSGVQRGPFDSQQMQAWFASGYFTTSLQVCRLGDSNYQKLGFCLNFYLFDFFSAPGDLFLINGEHTPFISKQTVGQNPTISNPQRPIEQRQLAY
uniref:GYF domain-containing protein n=1 Tax=Meloidogyne hapla TaxID=6305 RepID=A0A1I8B3N2_MELHA